MIKATISEGKVYIERPNKLQKYVQDSINDAVERLKNNILIEEDPLEYIIKNILGLDIPYDPEWQPYAQYAKDNLADTETALKFIFKHYQEFGEVVDHMANNHGSEFYEHIFTKGFDLVRLTVIVYTEITDQINQSLKPIDEDLE